jgi:hypothetical protein
LLSSSPRLIYLFVGHASRVVTFNANSVRRQVVVKKLNIMYNFSAQVMSYILNMLICVGMILLDNLLQCLLFIAMIDLSRIYNNVASLICYVLVMIIIYSQIKIKLKILIYPTLYTRFSLLGPQ